MQPIKKKIVEANPEFAPKPNPYYTLLVDGSNLLKISLVDEKINSRGEYIGGIFQFLIQLRKILVKKDWDFVYVFFDGPMSGILRYHLYPPYKANRDKHYELFGGETAYDKQMNDYCKKVLSYYHKKKVENNEKLNEKENEKLKIESQEKVLVKYFEEMSIRWIMDDRTEGDDLIAYYVNNRKSDERIVIMSADGDITQLIDEYVAVYNPRKKIFITDKNDLKELGYPHQNIVLKKILTGDSSDNIKGIAGLGETTLANLVPEITKKPITLEDVIIKAKMVNEERIKSKKKPLLRVTNIINGVSDYEEKKGQEFYELNKSIISLSKPLITKEAQETLDNMRYTPIDPEGRGFQNLYKYIVSDDITDLKDSNRFASFFEPFKKLVNKELQFFKKCQEK